MALTGTRSTGQGFQSSHSTRTLTAASRFSVVRRLAARSLSGDGLHIRTHQHFGLKLHLVWSLPSITANIHTLAAGLNLTSWGCIRRTLRHAADAVRADERCVQRVIYIGMHNFCNELVRVGAEGLCFCACVYGWLPVRNLEDKTFDCFHRGDWLGVTKYLDDVPTELRYLRDRKVQCKCNVTLSEDLWWV
jgi:hypothetical protein